MINGVRVICLYAPNGEARGRRSMRTSCAGMSSWRAGCAKQKDRHLAVLGDMNVAPEDRDVHDPKRWVGKIHVSEPERTALRTVVDVASPMHFGSFRSRRNHSRGGTTG